MKKKVVAVFVLFIMCVGIFFVAGCVEQHERLQLLGIRQIADGSLVLEIKDIEEVPENCTIQVSFDGGMTWENTKIRRDYIFVKDEYENYYCVTKVSENRYAKKCNITVRLASDRKIASKKSNVIEYYVKSPSDFNARNSFISELDSDNDYIDEYVFLNEDDKIVLKKFYKTEIGGSLILPVEEKDQLEFEYKTIKKSDIPEHVVEYVKDNLEKPSFIFKDVDEDDLEWLTYSFFALEEMSSYQDDKQFKDYNYQDGISLEECGEWVTMDYDGINETYVYLYVRLKGSDSTTYSNSALIRVSKRS